MISFHDPASRRKTAVKRVRIAPIPGTSISGRSATPSQSSFFPRLWVAGDEPKPLACETATKFLALDEPFVILGSDEQLRFSGDEVVEACDIVRREPVVELKR